MEQSQTQSQTQSQSPKAKCDTVVVCFAVIIIGQGWLLRHTLAAGLFAWPLAVTVELIFCIVMLAAVIWCWTHPKGWTSNLGCGIAFGVFALYLVFNLFFYSDFSQMYLAGINADTPSWGKALVALKLILAIMGVVAGIPAAPAPSNREYAEKMRQAVYRQEAEWAKGNAKGAKADLEKTLQKLKESLSPEEMETLLAELRSGTAASPEEKNDSAEDADESVAEKWRGWGGGV